MSLTASGMVDSKQLVKYAVSTVESGSDDAAGYLENVNDVVEVDVRELVNAAAFLGCVAIGVSTTFSVLMEGSFDGVYWSTIATLTQATITWAAGKMVLEGLSDANGNSIRFNSVRCTLTALGVSTVKLQLGASGGLASGYR